MDLYIKGVPAVGTSRSTAKLMKTGQTTSYRTGDDGDLEAGRNVDFSTLAENNPFGNTNRFTSELGTQTYTNNIVIDWSTYDGSTVLGWRRTLSSSPIAWNASVDGALAVSIGTFTTGWRLPNIIELTSIVNYSVISLKINYSPFNLNAGGYYWTSTTVPNSTTQAYVFDPSNGVFLGQGKTTSSLSSYMPCRTFTVTGTTLS